MDELQVRTEEPGFVEHLDRARAGGVQRDRQPERARAAPVALGHLDGERPARRAADARTDVSRADAEREHAVAWHPVTLHAGKALMVHRLVVPHSGRPAPGTT